MTLDDEIAEARASALKDRAWWGRPFVAMGFDAAVALLRPKLDATNAEIAEKDAEIERVDARAERAQNVALERRDYWFKRAEVAEAALAESRTVSDAQRKLGAIAALLPPKEFEAKFAMPWSRLRAILEEPAAEGAP